MVAPIGGGVSGLLTQLLSRPNVAPAQPQAPTVARVPPVQPQTAPAQAQPHAGGGKAWPDNPLPYPEPAGGWNVNARRGSTVDLSV